MRNIIWIVVALAVAAGAYLLFSGRSVQEIATDAAEAVNAPAALDSASEAAGDTVEETDGAVTEAVEGRSGHGRCRSGSRDRRH
ncbi:MAG: hypothetical protein AAGG57_15040 [Pseudomonadota bacterium]